MLGEAGSCQGTRRVILGGGGGRGRNRGPPGHPEVHLNSPAKDLPLRVSEVASLSRRGLAGGHKGVQRLGMKKAKGS